MKLRYRTYLIRFVLISFFVFGLLYDLKGQYYVSVTGDDSNPGTLISPFLTVTRAISVSLPGDTIYVREGTFNPTATINIGSAKSGTEDKRYYMVAYPGERPVLDFSLLPYSSSNRGIRLSASYWTIKGFDIKRAGDNGMNISGSYNIIENCSFSENFDTGLQLGGGASYNKIINCDSYFNADPDNEDADGFAPKLDVGTGNYFYGCRAWQNSDDGWDGYLRGADSVSTTLENCWCFKNGYLKSGAVSSGNGNGYKMGGGDNSNSDKLMHNFALINCIAFDNRVKGFDQNNNVGSMMMLNCTADNNGSNYSISRQLNPGQSLTLKNCISYGSNYSLGNFAVLLANSWMTPFIVSSEDFISLDASDAYLPRKADGSLPEMNYLHLADGSDLIDSGTDVGLPFNGLAPDLGAFESNYMVHVEGINNKDLKFSLEQNYPNPFNPVTKIIYTIPANLNRDETLIILKVFNIIGDEIETLVDKKLSPGTYEAGFNGESLSSGVYIYKLQCGDLLSVRKMLLLK